MRHGRRERSGARLPTAASPASGSKGLFHALENLGSAIGEHPCLAEENQVLDGSCQGGTANFKTNEVILASGRGFAKCPAVVRGVAQPGRAPALGAGSRQFESGRPDHLKSHEKPWFPGLFSFAGLATFSAGFRLSPPDSGEMVQIWQLFWQLFWVSLILLRLTWELRTAMVLQ